MFFPLMLICGASLSSWRAWIEILRFVGADEVHAVALLMERVE